jgi:hypothetical protein
MHLNSNFYIEIQIFIGNETHFNTDSWIFDYVGLICPNQDIPDDFVPPDDVYLSDEAVQYAECNNDVSGKMEIEELIICTNI